MLMKLLIESLRKFKTDMETQKKTARFDGSGIWTLEANALTMRYYFSL